MLQVTCAIIVENDRVLCTQRNIHMSLALQWEFPGGKIEPGEGPDECIRREILEELNLGIKLLERGPSFFCERPADSDMELIPFVCRRESGILILKEHAQFLWCNPSEMQTLDWARADLRILDWWMQIHERHTG